MLDLSITAEQRQVEIQKRFHAAVSSFDVPRAERLLAAGADIDRPDLSAEGRGFNALQYAVTARVKNVNPDQSDQLVDFLLRHGANPNLKDSDGQTALHWSAGHANDRLTSTLLAHGADPRIQNVDRETPADLARSWTMDRGGTSRERQLIAFKGKNVELADKLDAHAARLTLQEHIPQVSASAPTKKRMRL